MTPKTVFPRIRVRFSGKSLLRVLYAIALLALVGGAIMVYLGKSIPNWVAVFGILTVIGLAYVLWSPKGQPIDQRAKLLKKNVQSAYSSAIDKAHRGEEPRSSDVVQ